MYNLLQSPHANENEQAIFIGFNWAWFEIDGLQKVRDGRYFRSLIGGIYKI
jgi:hypothetical protein